MEKPEISGNQIKIPPSHKFLADVDDFLEGILREFKTEDSVIADIAISVSELVNNAVTHGQKINCGLPVTVEINRLNDKIKISVTDNGGGFDPEELDDPLADENLLKEVGRGLFIVRSLMDSVDIEANDNGTTISITKTIQ
jgi:serine/threonine-protein kinase RsbW